MIALSLWFYKSETCSMKPDFVHNCTFLMQPLITGNSKNHILVKYDLLEVNAENVTTRCQHKDSVNLFR